MRKSETQQALRMTAAFALLFGGSLYLASSADAQTFGPQAKCQPVSFFKSKDCCDTGCDTTCAAPIECCEIDKHTCAAPEECCDKGCEDNTCDDGCCGSICDWCNLGEPWTLQSIFDKDKGCCDDDICGGKDNWLTIGGWTQWGYHSENNGLFNDHEGRFNNHQSWLYAEKVADASDPCTDWDWGFRVDVVYGVDAQDTQAFGQPNPETHWDNAWDHGIYGWAIPQLYGEVAFGDWAIKIGHFYTLAGYEVVAAPDNFFYSHAYTMYNSEPFTHTGALATYTGLENVTLYGGWTAGWDTGFDSFTDGDSSRGSNFHGGFSVPVGCDATLTYITSIGDFGERGEGYSHSIVLDVALTEKLNYVLQSDLTQTNSSNVIDGITFDDYQIGLNNYLIYTINDCLGIGARAEWWKLDGTSFYEATFGVNYRPHANLVIRPEVRHDWIPGLDSEETTFGIDAILTF